MVVVLGGGVGGLSAAYYLLKNGNHKVIISEASNHLGGWVKTIKDKKTGVIFETGPRTIRPSGVQGLNTLSLIEEINLSDKVRPIKSDHPAAQNRFIYANEKLLKLPTNMRSVFRKTPPFSKALIFSFLRDLFAPVKKCSDDSIYNFVERRLGKDLADYAVSPMICGICAGDAKQISVKFLLPQFFKAEQEHGSILRGLYETGFFKNKSLDEIKTSNLSERAKKEKWNVWMLDGGLQTLTDKLTTNIQAKGAQIMLNSQCTDIRFEEGNVTCTIGDKELETNHIISTLPAHALASLLENQHKILAEELLSIKFVTVGVVNLVYKGKVLKNDGFGLLVPPCEKLPILGIIFDSCCYQRDDVTILTVMMGGNWFSEYFGENSKEEHLLDTALGQVKQILQIHEDPESYNVVILKDCIPQYVVGHYEKVDRIHKYIEQNKLPMSLSGCSFHGVGLNDVILSSKKAVDNLYETCLSI